MSRLLSRAVVLACVGLVSAFALADGFDLSRHTIGGGGGTKSTGGAFELSGTIGQPAVTRTMAGGEIELTGGFWFETPPGDCDFDGVINLAEFSSFSECATGPIGPMDSECRCFDIDRDGDVDLADFSRFLTSFNER